MSRRTYVATYQPARYVFKERKRYTFWRFLFDVLMIGLTHGWWLLWILIREIRNRW